MSLPPHIEWLAVHRGAALRALLDAQHVELHVEAALEVLMAADPSPGLHAVDWLCNTLVAGGMRWEDLAAGRGSKAAQTLDWFAQHRRALPPGHRNLEDYQSLASVYRAVEPLLVPEVPVDTPSGKQLRREAAQAARADSIILHNTPELIVAVPLTKGAAQWWGRGTRWCTAAEKSNYFDSYNDTAPLIVVVIKGVARDAADAPSGALEGDTPSRELKLQLHLDSDDDTQFMDASDEDVTPEFVHQHWSRLSGLITWALERDGSMIRYVPPQHLTPRICARAVAENGGMLQFVPYDMRTPGLCALALSKTTSAYKYIPARSFSPEVYTAMVTARSSLLEFVPLRSRTREICHAAIGIVGQSMRYVPAQWLDAEYYTLMMRKNGLQLQNVPSQYKTYDLCMAAVINNPSALKFVLDGVQDSRLGSMAVSANGLALQWVRPDLKSPALCRIAVEQNGRALAHVPPDLLDAELFHLAVQCNGTALANVPPHLRSPELVTQALSTHGIALECVPTEDRTRELCMLALGNSGAAWASIPKHLLDEEMCLIAVSRTADLLGIVPTELRTPAVCRAAVAILGNVLEHVPYDLRSYDLCVQACLGHPPALWHVPAGVRAAVQTALDQARLPEVSGGRPVLGPKWNQDSYFTDLSEYLENTGVELPVNPGPVPG